MSCCVSRSPRRLGVVVLVALAMALISGPRPSGAASGYWKYEGYQISPTNEYYATLTPMPGHVHELRATPGVQAGPGDAKGSIDLFFKTDNVDRVQFLATSTLSFGANAPLTTLVPGQKVVFDVTVVIGGNDRSRAVPARGGGTIAIDNGEYIVDVSTTFGETANGTGTATIPGGGPGATMTIHVGSYLAHLGAMTEDLRLRYVWVTGTPSSSASTAAASRFAAALGRTLIVREVAGADVYDGTWTRRDGTDVFDAVWNGSLRDVIEIESIDGYHVVLYRRGNNGRYSCTLSPDGSRITAGTASWYAADWSWSATVSGRLPAGR